MIIVAGHLPIAPEHRDAALAAIGECVAATRAEPANLDYRMSPDLDDPNRLNILERWESQEALDAHLAAPHMATFLTAIGPCVGGVPEVVRYDVSGSAPLF